MPRLEPFGTDEAVSAFQQFSAEVEAMQQDVLKDVATELFESAREYPPEREGSSYKRTFNLYRSIQMAQGPGGTNYIVSMPDDPGKFVKGDEDGIGQVWFHAGRWMLLVQNGEQAEDMLYEKLDTEMNKLKMKYGL